MATKSFSALLLLSAIANVSAFWRMECRGRTGLARIDPIMDAGSISPHIHTVHGSSGFSLSATFSELNGGSCTSCAVKQDMSAYWTPALYFQDSETKEFDIVPQIGGMLAYYLLRGDNVTAFPPGFQMIAGSNYRRDYTVGDPKSPDPPQSDWAALKQTGQDDLEQRAIGFNCLDYSKAAEGSLFRHYLPDKAYLDANCPDGIRIELMFPSCWNGETTSTNHKSHVAYPSLVGNGDCPDTHPQRLVTLFYETIWNTNDKSFQGRNGQFVVSNGDPTGFGYHGDFMSGWDQDFLQQAVDTCTNDSGDIRDCQLFVNEGPLQSDEEQNSCEFDVPAVLAKEDGSALNLKNLPGNLQIQAGPQSATPGAAGAGAGISSALSAASSWFDGVFGGDSATTSSTPSPTPSSVNTPTTPAGGAFIESPSSAASSQQFGALAEPAAPTSSSSTPPPAPTTTPAPIFTPEPGVSYEVVSTQTVTDGAQVEEIVWKEPVVYVTEDSVTTVTAPQQKLVRKLRERHVRRHQHPIRMS
ncbi:uncharacterized protein F4822DRAFT_184620 [Hypoxylon trugodes]|uniref:uncharacterized protein n=1 Tax=Hypoxylon trugodes TaxID=326681 RepID=UPI00219F9CE2|nr:uncharacterized protein F4822DRAFT_184620 [Hypoxylon trugodes]KAI1391395.1 hypothetical protein F4822DRAFT_184620 [Hypoxylon trugodes]